MAGAFGTPARLQKDFADLQPPVPRRLRQPGPRIQRVLDPPSKGSYGTRAITPPSFLPRTPPPDRISDPGLVGVGRAAPVCNSSRPLAKSRPASQASRAHDSSWAVGRWPAADSSCCQGAPRHATLTPSAPASSGTGRAQAGESATPTPHVRPGRLSEGGYDVRCPMGLQLWSEATCFFAGIAAPDTIFISSGP